MKKKYLELISDALNFVESNLTEPINVQSVCGRYPFTSWQFQRVFRAYVGDSIGSYLRIRRLTLAAEDILDGAENRILDVAIKYQFGSQEAFSRAFKSHFGITPTEILQNRAVLILKKKPILNLEKIDQLQYLLKQEPEIIDFGVRHFVGLEKEMLSPLDSGPSSFNEIPGLWTEFGTMIKFIKGRMPGNSYGIGKTDDGSMASETVRYMAAIEVEASKEQPPYFRRMTMNPQRYAHFTFHGTMKEFYTAINYIYGVWLPSSKFERAAGSDYEMFGRDFDLSKPNSTITYAIPVKPPS